MTRDKIKFIKSNLHLSDAELAEHFKLKVWQIKRVINFYKLKRNKTQLSQIKQGSL